MKKFSTSRESKPAIEWEIPLSTKSSTLTMNICTAMMRTTKMFHTNLKLEAGLNTGTQFFILFPTFRTSGVFKTKFKKIKSISFTIPKKNDLGFFTSHEKPYNSFEKIRDHLLNIILQRKRRFYIFHKISFFFEKKK